MTYRFKSCRGHSRWRKDLRQIAVSPFFMGEALDRPLGGRIGFTLDLSRLPFGRECRAEVESWRGWKKRDNGSSWSFG